MRNVRCIKLIKYTVQYVIATNSSVQTVLNGAGLEKNLIREVVVVILKINPEIQKVIVLLGYDKENQLRKVKIASAIEENETLFGLGERFNGFVQNGKTVEMWKNFKSLH